MTYKLLEKMKVIIGNDPVVMINAAIAPLFMCVPWNSDKYPLHNLCISKGRDTYFILNEKRYFALATDMFRKYYLGNISIEQLEEEYNTYEKHAEKLYSEVMSKALLALSDEELLKYIHNVNCLYDELIKTIYIETIDYDKILSVIGTEKKVKLDTVWEKATESTFVSFEGRYLRNMLKIVSSKDGNEVRRVKFMFTDYFWAKSDEEIAVSLREVKDNENKKIQEVESIYTDIDTRKRDFVAWLNTLDSDSKRIVEYMQLVMRLRDIRKDPIAQVLAILVDITTIMTERAGIDSRHAPYILLYEYMKGVDYLRSIQEDVKTRESGCAYLVSPDYSYEIEHCDFKEIVVQFNEWTKHHEHISDELKGQIACRGCVRGVVRVVSDPHDSRGFQNGDILVTSMTRPEFVPIMKQAGAVITNEGGITCHAAIVSRELKIPCIIGTKIATQVLKDGDFVEVDADNGIVRIIKK